MTEETNAPALTIQERIAKAQASQTSPAAAPQTAPTVTPADDKSDTEAAADPALPEEVTMQEGAEYNQYFSTLPAFSMCLPTGERIRFIKYRHLTNLPRVIEFLDIEAARPTAQSKIHTKPGEETIMSDEVDPQEALIKRTKLETYKELGIKVRMLPPSSSQQGNFKPASTQTAAAVQAGSMSLGQ